MTDAEMAILTLLAEGPNYDHTLGDLIQQRGLRRWTAIGESSMYYVLDKLEKQGLIQKEVEADGKKRYNISSAGIGVLQTAVVDLLSTPHSHDKTFELGLANIHVLRSSQVRAALNGRQQDIITQLHKLRNSLEREKANGSVFEVTALFSHRITMMEAELKWLDTFIGAWEAQAIPDPETMIDPVIIPRGRQVILPQDPDSVHKQVTQPIPPHRRQTPAPQRTNPNLPKKKDSDAKPDPTEPEI